MEVSLFVWFLACVVLVSLVLLASVCLDCGNKGPMVSIPQGHASEEYIPSAGFRLIHPYQSSIDANSINPPSTLLSPFSPSLDVATQRHHSFTPTENESNPSYENPVDGPEYENESDGEEPGYVKVLPDPPKVEIRQSSQSLASTHSSVDVEPHYVNVDPSIEPDDRDYLNVELLQTPAALNWMCANDKESDDDDDDDDDDDEEGNYVNQPAMMDD
ncbi:linker for activation of T-cells family member 1 isoform X2 [Centroberyx affinis]|uniref:linker for activation of T-cells family member 1 isoform X2 n=1 Tax=Centroberyx affinis TaxID=166261 RepID=UPI003A5BF0F1